MSGLADRPLWRMVPAALLVGGSVVLGWDYLVQSLGQGAEYVHRGWFATLIGAFVLAMAAWVPLAALLVGLVPTYALRLSPPRVPMTEGEQVPLVAGGFVLFAIAMAAPAAFMWAIAKPRATAYAGYGTAFDWTAGVMIVSLALGASLLCTRVLAGRPAKAPPAIAPRAY